SDIRAETPSIMVIYNSSEDTIEFNTIRERLYFKRDKHIVLGFIRHDDIDNDAFFFGVYSVEGEEENTNTCSTEGLFMYNERVDIVEEREVSTRSNITTSYIYDIYDGLLNDFPHYITKSEF